MEHYWNARRPHERAKKLTHSKHVQVRVKGGRSHFHHERAGLRIGILRMIVVRPKHERACSTLP